MHTTPNAVKQTVEAYGVKGMKGTPWRKSFKSAEALERWATHNDADVYGMRDSED